MTSLLAFVSLADIGDSFREAFFMFWETLWALVLGFTLSGAVQAFVSKRQMQRVMGDHQPAAVARASGFGMVSSSCSYAATAMAKSLFQKGADFTTAMIFMFASTNLVLELGIVLLVLMGWQFAARGVHRRTDHDRRARAGRRLRVLAEAGPRRVRRLEPAGRPRVRHGDAPSTAIRSRARRAGATRPRSRCPTSGCCAASS